MVIPLRNGEMAINRVHRARVINRTLLHCVGMYAVFIILLVFFTAWCNYNDFLLNCDCNNMGTLIMREVREENGIKSIHECSLKIMGYEDIEEDPEWEKGVAHLIQLCKFIRNNNFTVHCITGKNLTYTIPLHLPKKITK